MNSQLTYSLAVLLSIILCGVFAKVGFVKDQNEDAEFPVFSHRSEGGIPQGHLRPLGWQRHPQRKLRELKSDIDSLDVYNKLKKAPFVFRNLTRKAGVLKKWATDDYLKQHYGNISVSVTVKKEVIKKTYLKTMSLKKFLLDYLYEDWLLTNTVPREMEHELPLPVIIGCGSFASHVQETELWMSSGGTSSLLHSHDDLSFHCVLFGRKDFIVIEPEYKDIFDYQHKYKNSLAGWSPIDTDMVNMYKYKKIAQVPWTWTTLRQGDCVLIPAGKLHQVRSYGRTIAYTILVGGFKEFNAKNCPAKRDITLANVHKTWTYVNGTKKLSHSRLRHVDVKYHLLKLMRSKNVLSFEVFEDFYYDVMQYYQADASARQVFQYLDPKLNGFVTKKALLATPRKTLSKVAQYLNAPNTKGHPIVIHDEF